MVSVGGGASAPAASTYGGGGGVGGKATRIQSRKSRPTPYDRPPTARRNPSLLSKLVVDPIKNLASSAAHRFFASVTGKRLTPPTPPQLPPEPVQEFGDGIGDAIINNNAEAPEPSTIDGQKFPMADTGGISELEHLLRGKTFTKSEIDHLTELLQSKAVDLQVNHNVKRTEINLSDPGIKFEKPLQLQKNPSAENGNLREISHSVISTPGINSRVFDEDVASPAELAKAYMGSRPSKVSPSMLGLRSQAFREEASLLSSSPFNPKSTMISLAPKVTPRLELSEKSFTAARSRGRSAIYNMARTPYSRLPRTVLGKETEPRRYRNEEYLLPSPSLQDQDGEPSSTRLVLKRRSSVLDDDIGSVGPMRRIRQRHSLSSQRFSAPPTRGIGSSSGSLQQSQPLKETLPLTDDWKYNTLKMVGKNEDNCAPSTSYVHVPRKSTEMAARILQQLEKVAPKEKSSEFKLVTAKEKSPAKLTADMLHGKALSSLEDVNSSKLLLSTQGNQRFEDLTQSSTIRNHQEQERIERNGPKTLSVQHKVSTTLVNKNSTTSVKDLVPNAASSDSMPKLPVAERPQKKRAFMMSAHEDSLDLDEEPYSNGKYEAVGGRGKSEAALTNHSSVSAEKVMEVTTAPLHEVKKSTAEPVFGKKTVLEDQTAPVISGEKNGVAFPVLHTFSTSPSVAHSQLPTVSDVPKQENKKVPGRENSPVHSVPDLSAPNPGFWTQPSLENLKSSLAITPTLEVPGSNKNDYIKTVESAEFQGRHENLHSGPSSVPSSMVVSSAPEKLNLKNGPLSINPSTVLSTPTVASTGFATQSLAAGTSPLSNTANVTNFAASTWSSATSSISPSESSGTLIFQSGSTVNPSTVVSSSVSTTSDSVSSVGKTNSDKEANASSLSNTPLGVTSFASGSSIFGLSASSAASTKSPSETAASGFVFGTQSSDVISGDVTISKDVPFQFGSSGSSSVFCSSGVSSFMSSSPTFSSAPANKLFGTGTSIGFTSTSSVESKSVDSGSSPSGLFSSGTGASAASSGGNAFSISSGSSPSTFSFGISSPGTSSFPNAPVSSSSTPPAICSFGASSSSGTGMISSFTGSGSAIFGASTFSSSTETNAASSGAAASVSFGSNWKTPNSPFGATTTSPVFAFGASSSSFSAGNTAPAVVGSASATSPGFGFSFTTASAGTSVSPSLPFVASSPIFGNSTSTFTASGNNDQMSMEDSMAEDVQAAAHATPVFGQQQPVSASPGGFAFGSPVPQSVSPFQFGGQQNQATLPGGSPFQASGSMEFNAGGSFSLGSGGGPTDKANRRIVRPVRSNKHRKK